MTKMTFNYQQELSRFLYTGCSKLTGYRIMIVKKLNLILEARYCGKLIGEICNFFTPMSRFPHFHGLWIFNIVVHDLDVFKPVCMLRIKRFKGKSEGTKSKLYGCSSTLKSNFSRVLTVWETVFGCALSCNNNNINFFDKKPWRLMQIADFS